MTISRTWGDGHLLIMEEKRAGSLVASWSSHNSPEWPASGLIL